VFLSLTGHAAEVPESEEAAVEGRGRRTRGAA